jgi:3-phenylpropionate/trans-cinnamate dioxygenase ferredoxin reductase subunit
VHYLRTHPDAIALRARLRAGQRVVVIGGGFLGLEVAASATSRGCAVTVIEAGPRVLGRVVPAPAAAVLATRHLQAGVDLRVGVGVTALIRREDTVRVSLTTGQTLTCDTVVACIGAVPDTTLAEKAGLAVDNGVRVDADLATTDPDIHAAGDCCSLPHPLYDQRRIRLEAWRAAEDQAPIAAQNMLGAHQPFTAVPSFWSDQYELTLHIVGLPDTATTTVTRHRPDGHHIQFGLAPDGRLLAATTVGPGTTLAKDIRITEKLIARRATVDPATLTDATTNLKTLLRG